MVTDQDQIITNALHKANCIGLFHREKKRTIRKAYENTLTPLIVLKIRAICTQKVSGIHRGFEVSDQGLINFTGVTA